ncbi:MAG: hypothetical protein FWG87_06055 [Defluviitaleaceae bacterium]|nr:hypothetical protein [Defluviitaleaceae bacterium]
MYLAASRRFTRIFPRANPRKSAKSVFNLHVSASYACRGFRRGRIYPSRDYLALR